MKPGRKFETMVADIERSFSPEGATIESPSKVYDKAIQDFRDVDVAIRYTVGTHPVLIVVQCRDRSRPATVQWIDEVIGETRDLCANVVVAVSSSGFSQKAKTKAKHHGIRTRVLEEVTPEEIAAWKNFGKITVGYTRCNVQALTPIFADDSFPHPPTFSDEAMAGLNKNYHTYVLCREVDSGREITVDDMVGEWRKGPGKKFFDELPLNGERKSVFFPYWFDHEVEADSEIGKRRLLALIVHIAVSRGSYEIPPQALRYLDDEAGAFTTQPFWKLDVRKLFPGRYDETG